MRTLEQTLELRNALQTANDYDVLDSLDAFMADDIRGCVSAYTDYANDGFTPDFVDCREVFGLGMRS